MKIVVAEKVAPSALAVFKEQSDWTVATPEKDALAAELADADALLVRSAVFVDAAMMDKAPKLRVIGRAGVGVDNIDLDAATKRGIVVMNTPGGNAIAVAEHTLALMLALARHLTRADATTHAGKWEKKSLQGTELRGKTLGIVGLGKIGMEVAKRAQSLRDEDRRARSLRRGQPGAAVADYDGSARRAVRERRLHHAARWLDAADAGHDQCGRVLPR